MPHGSVISNSPKTEKAQTPSECMELDWETDFDQVPDSPSRPCNDHRKPRPLKRHNQILKKPHRDGLNLGVNLGTTHQLTAQSTFQ